MRKRAVVWALVLLVPVAAFPGHGEEDVDTRQDWFFSTDEEFDLAVAKLRITPDQPTTCYMKGMIAGIVKAYFLPDGGWASPEHLTRAIIFEENQTPFFWFYSAGGAPAGVQVEGIGASTFADDGLGWRMSARTTKEIDGPVDIMVIAHQLSPVETSYLSEPNSIEFTVKCDRPVQARLSGDPHVRYVTPDSTSPGVTAWTYLTGGQILAARVGGHYTSDEVWFRGYVSGQQVSRIDLEHPEGTDSHIFGPAYDSSRYLARNFTDPSGEYMLQANRLSLDPWSWFWSFLAGFHEVDSLDEIKDLPTPGPLSAPLG